MEEYINRKDQQGEDEKDRELGEEENVPLVQRRKPEREEMSFKGRRVDRRRSCRGRRERGERATRRQGERERERDTERRVREGNSTEGSPRKRKPTD